MIKGEQISNQEQKHWSNCLLCVKADDSSDDDDDDDVPTVARFSPDPDIPECSFSPELKDALCDVVDADFGLLKQLREYQWLKSVIHYKSSERSSKLMMQVLPRAGFFNALLDTSQQHVLNFVKRWENEHWEWTWKPKHVLDDVDAKCYPLTTQQRCVLDENMLELAKLLNFDDFLPRIHAARCITRKRREFVEKAPSELKKAKRSLRILLKRSQIDYYNVASSLDSLGQGHISRVLKEGGAVLTVHVEIEDQDAAALAAKLETRFKEWSKQSTPEEKRLELEAKWSELGADTILMDIKQSANLSVFIHLTTLPAVQRVESALENGKLKFVLEAIFSILLKGRCCDVRELLCSVANYNSCLNYFYKTLGCYDAFVLPRPYYVAAKVNDRNHNLALLEWPTELSEILLVKATILTFKQLRKSIPSSSADKLAAIVLCMVCRRWWSVLTHRSFIKQQIERTLDYVCRPFRRKIELKRSLEFLDGRYRLYYMGGFAVIDHQLLVAAFLYERTIVVYDAKSSGWQHVVNVSGMDGKLFDIATCGLTRRVYLVEGVCRDDVKCVLVYIRIIDWPSSFNGAGGGSNGGAGGGGSYDKVSLPARKFIAFKGFYPKNLSVGAGGQLLVSGFPYLDPQCSRQDLYVYDVNGTMLRYVQLPNSYHDRHLTPLPVFTTGAGDDSYIMCSFKAVWQVRQVWQQKKRRLFERSLRSTYVKYQAEIAEYSYAGQRLRSYTHTDDGLAQVHVDHCCLVPTGDGRYLTIVYENIYTNLARVLLLDSELRPERVLLDVETIARRIRYNPQTGHIFLDYWDPGGCTPRIDVYC